MKRLILPSILYGSFGAICVAVMYKIGSVNASTHIIFLFILAMLYAMLAQDFVKSIKKFRRAGRIMKSRNSSQVKLSRRNAMLAAINQLALAILILFY